MYLKGNIQEDEESEEEHDAIVMVLVLFGFFAIQSSSNPLTGVDIVTDLIFFILRFGLAVDSVRMPTNMIKIELRSMFGQAVLLSLLLLIYKLWDKCGLVGGSDH